MIYELTNDIINKLNTVPELVGKVGARVGGTDTDIAMVEAPIPFAWVLYSTSSPETNEMSNGRNYLIIQNDFVVILAIDYGSDITDSEFMQNSLSLIDKAVRAVHASEEVIYSGKWQYTGASLHTVYPNRLIYQLGFSVNGHIQIQ